MSREVHAATFASPPNPPLSPRLTTITRSADLVGTILFDDLLPRGLPTHHTADSTTSASTAFAFEAVRLESGRTHHPFTFCRLKATLPPRPELVANGDIPWWSALRASPRTAHFQTRLPQLKPRTRSTSSSMATQTTAPSGETVVLTPTATDDPAFKYDLKEDDPAEELEEETYKKKTLQQKILWGTFYIVASLAALYFFMVAVKFIGDGFTLALGCDSKGAFDFANNPVAGLMIGTISTALLHSSGTVTSITVALVGDPIRFQRAMAAATVHDMYNIWSVIVMFPIEVLFHPLEKMSIEMSDATISSGAFNSPVDAIVNPLAKKLISVDKSSIYKVATGDLECTPGLSFVKGGAFEGSSMSDGSIGAIVIVLGFCILVCALVTLVKMLAKVFLGPTKTLISKLLNYNGYVNIFVGTLITFAVHSSTVVTSTLTPMAGLGVITRDRSQSGNDRNCSAGISGDGQGGFGCDCTGPLLVQRVWHLFVLPDPDHAQTDLKLGALTGIL
ncbi:unnamed protein product [Phytophthora lilii]|uniref:Unnamed protein product n=1 Tax=Phytophthora lilii TaxID=2077276 RepID=A0A9W6TD95_9STRA|nr:unnamed protein product [Phytophthora lilii]